MRIIEGQIRDMKNRICGVMLILANAVDGKKATDLPEDIETQIKTLQSYVLHR